MNIYDHRRGRLLALINERFEGVRKNFCDATGWSEARISQLFSLTYRGGSAFTEKTARRLETAAGLPSMYFDQGAAPAPLHLVEDDPDLDAFGPAQSVVLDRGNTDVIAVKLVNLRLQAGYPRFEADEIFDEDATIDLPRQWVEENGLVPNCLVGIRVKGASMEPMIFEGEKIVINIADTKLVSGHIYAVNYDGKAIVKQMVYRNKDWWLHSFNPADEFIPMRARNGDCVVIGKLVYQPGRSLIGKT